MSEVGAHDRVIPVDQDLVYPHTAAVGLDLGPGRAHAGDHVAALRARTGPRDRVVPGYVPVDLLSEQLGEHVGVAADEPLQEESDQIGSGHRSPARLGRGCCARHGRPARLRRGDRLLVKHENGIVPFRQCIMYDGRKVRGPARLHDDLSDTPQRAGGAARDPV